MLAIFCAVVLFCAIGSVNEYATGPAVVRIVGKTTLAAETAGLVATVEVQPGQRVEKGQRLVTFASREETSLLERLDREFELQLVRFLRDPEDATARQALTTLRADRELAQARLDQRTLKAPFTGVVGDVRIQPGQYLPVGTPVLSLVGPDSQASLIALLPGYYRPFLQPGMPLRVELDGFRYDYREFTIDSVGNQVVGPGEVRRYLGMEVGDALSLEGPLVLVKVRLPAAAFISEGRELEYFDGMSARAEVRVRSENMLRLIIPGLRRLGSHDS
ncbi:efflux RND transporter periplasmic adaptor subunit [Hyalangium gracile]|uniref:efflux RND transporter periplasmic adaptor subunit n=1 Tax=Hyalangium gracile TaxID=394092 RepID=UPI001CC9BB9B|nr:HlyD family efflux transporter periplasmic adaptor subunit [Hyalangium gracile]